MDEATTRARRWARRVLLPATLMLTLTLGLAACGGDSPTATVASLDDGTENASNDADNADNAEMTDEERQQAMLDYARCMREHGIDMPDPTFDSNGRGAITISGGSAGEPMDQSAMDAAQEACQPLMQDVIDSAPEMDPEEVEQRKQEALEFAKCMRDHGVDFPDPVFGDGGRMTQAMTADPGDPNFQSAQEECGRDGGGPGFSIGGPVGSADSGMATNGDSEDSK
jgi:hypothetical protein